MSSQSLFPSTVVSNVSLTGFSQNGNITWTNPTNVETTNAVYTTAITSTSNPYSYILTCTNFGFSIPSGSTINGISAAIIGHVSITTRGQDLQVSLLKAGTGVGSNYATLQGVGITGSTTDVTETYGSGTTDLWGTTWAYTDINSSGFGIGYEGQSDTSNCTFSIDSVKLTVYYTGGAAGSSLLLTPMNSSNCITPLNSKNCVVHWF